MVKTNEREKKTMTNESLSPWMATMVFINWFTKTPERPSPSSSHLAVVRRFHPLAASAELKVRWENEAHRQPAPFHRGGLVGKMGKHLDNVESNMQPAQLLICYSNSEFLNFSFSITVKGSNFLVAFPAPSPQVNGGGQTSIQQLLGRDVRELEYLQQVFILFSFSFHPFSNIRTFIERVCSFFCCWSHTTPQGRPIVWRINEPTSETTESIGSEEQQKEIQAHVRNFEREKK